MLEAICRRLDLIEKAIMLHSPGTLSDIFTLDSTPVGQSFEEILPLIRQGKAFRRKSDPEEIYELPLSREDESEGLTVEDLCSHDWEIV